MLLLTLEGFEMDRETLRAPASDWIARSRETPDLSSNAIYMGAT